jgi:hypothetical protein
LVGVKSEGTHIDLIHNPIIVIVGIAEIPQGVAVIVELTGIDIRWTVVEDVRPLIAILILGVIAGVS